MSAKETLPTVTVCDCCLLMVANGDDSGCRDYYGHTHPTANVPAWAVPGDDDDTEERWYVWACEGCGQDMLPGAQAHTLYVIREVSA